MNDKLKGALIGGLVAGILSSIPVVGTCSCLWAILGGFLAGYLLIKDSPIPVTVGGGATAGALAGVVGAIIFFIVRLLLSMVLGMAETMAAISRTGVQLPFSGTVLLIIASLIGVLLIIGFGTIGGLIAVPVFEKRKSGTEPPAPPAF